VASVFRDAYAEIHEQLKKLRSACERGDAVRASEESRAVQNDISRMLGATRTAVGYGDFNRLDEFRGAYRALGLPDLMAAYDSEDLDRLADLAEELDTRIGTWLEEQGIALNVFQNTGELARWLARGR
jgi:predicted component of type VI protein secretion system